MKLINITTTLLNNRMGKFVLSLLITGLIVAYFFKGHDLSLTQLKDIVSGISFKELLVAFFVFVIANLTRSYRFYYLARSPGASLRNMVASNNIYNFATATLPGGVGEGISVFLFKKYNNMRLAESFSVILLSRIMDLLMMSMLVLLSFIIFETTTLNLSSTLVVTACSAMVAVCFLMLLPWTQESILKLIVLIINYFPSRIISKEKLNIIFIKIKSGFLLIQNVRKLVICLILSFAVMLMNIIILFYILHSIQIVLPFESNVVIFGIYCIMQVIPVHGVAGVGTQEAWWTLALMMVGIDKVTALPASFVIHGVFYVFIGTVAVTLGWPLLKKKEISSTL